MLLLKQVVADEPGGLAEIRLNTPIAYVDEMSPVSGGQQRN